MVQGKHWYQPQLCLAQGHNGLTIAGAAHWLHSGATDGQRVDNVFAGSDCVLCSAAWGHQAAATCSKAGLCMSQESVGLRWQSLSELVQSCSTELPGNKPACLGKASPSAGFDAAINEKSGLLMRLLQNCLHPPLHHCLVFGAVFGSDQEWRK